MSDFEILNLDKKEPLVSIAMLAYNHEKYISQAIDSILMQETNFDYKIIIAEDYSTDRTRQIIRKYQEKYPNKFKLILQNSNAGVNQNNLDLLSNLEGKYIAALEGDDYWTGPLKLQKQVDFLEANPEYGLCCHNVQQLNTFDNSKSTIIPNLKDDADISLQDYVLSNTTATCSIMFRADCFFPIKQWFKQLPFGDLGLILTVLKASNQKAHVLKDVMGVYRIHEKGIHGNLHKNNKRLINAYKQHIQFTKIIKQELLTEKEYRGVILQKMSNTHNILAKLYKKENLQFQSVKSLLLKKYYKFVLNNLK